MCRRQVRADRDALPPADDPCSVARVSTRPSSFANELLLPRRNAEAYQRIYEAETWLRRICLTAYMVAFGRTWDAEIPGPVRARLVRRVDQNRRRRYLGGEDSDDLIWLSTQGELSQLPNFEGVGPEVQDVCGVEPAHITTQLEIMREIRNVLAHNRALGDRAHRILDGAVAALEYPLHEFKMRFLYTTTFSIQMAANTLGGRLDELVAARRRPMQAFMASGHGCIELVSLPVAPFGRYPDARALIRSFAGVLDAIIAFGINKTADEYHVLMPSCLTPEDQDVIVSMFASDQDVWTREPFEEQAIGFACHPKVWYYENRTPELE